ncbi:MAG: hypothetical protein H5U20_01070, partial [Rhodobacteraceae bacterium]|nr:hypothetical protein [Paracoccaceae bacterium]
MSLARTPLVPRAPVASLAGGGVAAAVLALTLGSVGVVAWRAGGLPR